MKLRGGKIKRLADGRVLVRAKDGTATITDPSGLSHTTTSTSFNEPVHLALTDEEAWDVFDTAARDQVGMDGEAFLKAWDTGAFGP